MAINFRKSKSFGPFRFTLSKSGISSSFGVKGLRLSSGPRGVHSTVGIPGTGIYSRNKISNTTHIGPKWNRWDSKFGVFAKIMCAVIFGPIALAIIAGVLFLIFLLLSYLFNNIIS